MDALNSMLQGAGLFKIASDIYGGSGASGFIARMMAENRVKNKGAYGPKTDLPKGSMMSAPAKFDLKRIANATQKKGSTNTKDYGASPFLLKHFGVDDDDAPRYKPSRYRTPVPDAPFKLYRNKKDELEESESESESESEASAPRGTYKHTTAKELLQKQAEEALARTEGPLKKEWNEESDEYNKLMYKLSRADWERWRTYLGNHFQGRKHEGEPYVPWSQAPAKTQAEHGYKGGKIEGNPDPSFEVTKKGPTLFIEKGPGQPTLKEYLAIKNMAHIADAIAKSPKYYKKEDYMRLLLIAIRLVDEGHREHVGSPPITDAKKIKEHQDFAIAQYDKGDGAIYRQYEKSGLREALEKARNAWTAKTGKTAQEWMDTQLLPAIANGTDEKILGKKAYTYLTADI